MEELIVLKHQAREIIYEEGDPESEALSQIHTNIWTVLQDTTKHYTQYTIKDFPAHYRAIQRLFRVSPSLHPGWVSFCSQVEHTRLVPWKRHILGSVSLSEQIELMDRDSQHQIWLMDHNAHNQLSAAHNQLSAAHHQLSAAHNQLSAAHNQLSAYKARLNAYHDLFEETLPIQMLKIDRNVLDGIIRLIKLNTLRLKKDLLPEPKDSDEAIHTTIEVMSKIRRMIDGEIGRFMAHDTYQSVLHNMHTIVAGGIQGSFTSDGYQRLLSKMGSFIESESSTSLFPLHAPLDYDE